MDKKTLAGIALFVSAGGVASASPAVDLQALQLLQENRISQEEFARLTSAAQDSGTWSNTSITSGTWSNTSITNDTWSNTSITDGTWSNTSLTNSTWSNTGVINGSSLSLQGAKADSIPSPELAKGIED